MFITLEGTEGSGKSTLCKLLKQAYPDALFTREPHDEKIRDILLNSELGQTAEILLFLGDRAEHVEKTIGPALVEGKMVICDRYIDSTIAYQGYGRGQDIEHLKSLNHFATHGLLPDITFLLDLPVEVGLERARKRGGESWTRFEAEEVNFHKKIRQGFIELGAEKRFSVIDATLSPEEILSRVKSEIELRRTS